MGVVLLPEELSYHPLPEKSSAADDAIWTFSNRQDFPLRSSCRDRTFVTRPSISSWGQATPMAAARETLLIILNYDTNQNMELLEKAGQALKSPGDIRVLIKAHPTTDVQKMSGFLQDIRFPALRVGLRHGHGAARSGSRRADDRGICLQHGNDCRRGPPGPGVAGEQLSISTASGTRYPSRPRLIPGRRLRGSSGRGAAGGTGTSGIASANSGKTMVENYFEPVTPETLRVFYEAAGLNGRRASRGRPGRSSPSGRRPARHRPIFQASLPRSGPLWRHGSFPVEGRRTLHHEGDHQPHQGRAAGSSRS